MLFVDEESAESKDKIIIKDISNVPIFKSFHFKCSVYTSRIYLYDEVCRSMIICETKGKESYISIIQLLIEFEGKHMDLMTKMFSKAKGNFFVFGSNKSYAALTPSHLFFYKDKSTIS